MLLAGARRTPREAFGGPRSAPRKKKASGAQPNTLCIADSGVNGFTGGMPTFVTALTGFWPSRRVDLFDGFCRRDV